VAPKRKKKGQAETKPYGLSFHSTPSAPQSTSFLQQALLPASLNEAQQEAVRHAGGPLLIVAGPGTGKTFTLAHRIARLLLNGGARPGQILAVTFTNKAAQAMAERLDRILDEPRLMEGLTIKTFHALCFEILSNEAKGAGEQPDITLADENDRTRFVKEAIGATQRPIARKKLDPEQISNFISVAKQRLLLPEDNLADLVPTALLVQFLSIYTRYQEILHQNHLHDFDDLVLRTVRLFEAHSAILDKYSKKFRFISVDEYQDINHAQYRLIRLIAPIGHDICVIGDPDQAIYGFRGADVRYFHSFLDDYPDAKTIHLRHNYRSTETILQASGQVIGVNRDGRTDLGMWSGLQGVKTLTIAVQPTEKAEAEFTVKTIDQEVGGITSFSMDSGRVSAAERGQERSFGDFAVLYRTRDLAKALEEAFLRSGIPFQIVGKEKLKDKKGIREVVCYLKAGCSIAGDRDMEKILNFPARGIGQAARRALHKWSRTKGHSLLTALSHVEEISDLKPGPAMRLLEFAEDLTRLKAARTHMNVDEQIDYIVDRFHIMDTMDRNKSFEEDLATLLNLSRSFGNRTLEFLAHLALESTQDRYDPKAEKVSLMTIHAAKGLEFPVVFITGCEDGLIPYRRTDGEQADLLEERRLFYVAMTRAQERIYLTHAKKRLLYGKKTQQNPSPFLEAVEENLKEYAKSMSMKRGRKKEDTQLRLFEL
jgi:superfamily I DNA/RNA helicase